MTPLPSSYLSAAVSQGSGLNCLSPTETRPLDSSSGVKEYGVFVELEPGIFGLFLVLFLIYDPQGIYGRWLKFRLYFEEFPLYRKATHKRQKSYLRTERLR